jgi:hypothetical protein
MKRDLNLIRQIILTVEVAPTGYLRNDLKIEGFTPEQIGYHSYLIVDAGLATGTDVTTQGNPSPKWIIKHLTSAGHDFADASRDDTAWQKAMGMVKDKGGSVSIDVVKQLLISFIKSQLNLHQ